MNTLPILLSLCSISYLSWLRALDYLYYEYDGRRWRERFVTKEIHSSETEYCSIPYVTLGVLFLFLKGLSNDQSQW